MTPALKNYLSTRDEFISDYLDRHGHNQATRTEAEDLADEWRDVARDAVQFARLAVKRAESAMDSSHTHVVDVAYECAMSVYGDSDEITPRRAAIITAAIKLAMSEGE